MAITDYDPYKACGAVCHMYQGFLNHPAYTIGSSSDAEIRIVVIDEASPFYRCIGTQVRMLKDHMVCQLDALPGFRLFKRDDIALLAGQLASQDEKDEDEQNSPKSVSCNVDVSKLRLYGQGASHLQEALQNGPICTACGGCTDCEQANEDCKDNGREQDG